MILLTLNFPTLIALGGLYLGNYLYSLKANGNVRRIYGLAFATFPQQTVVYELVDDASPATLLKTFPGGRQISSITAT